MPSTTGVQQASAVSVRENRNDVCGQAKDSGRIKFLEGDIDDHIHRVVISNHLLLTKCKGHLLPNILKGHYFRLLFSASREIQRQFSFVPFSFCLVLL